MIPYFQWLTIDLGPLRIHVWGLMVALGIVSGLLVALRVVKQRGLSTEKMIDVAFWVILASLIGSRLLYVASEFDLYKSALLDIFKIWEGGMSFSGGLIGALVAGWLYFRRSHLPWKQYVEAAMIGLPFGIGVGRLSCFFIYDHPGTPTSFFLGQQYIDGIVRHNHGLYLSLHGFLLAAIVLLLQTRNPKRPAGTYTAFFLIGYGVGRFILDFWRATDLPFSDARFFGLTVAQYVALAAVAAGGVIWYSLTHGTSTQTKTST